VYGEELASEPSQFLNEMPLELIDDLSRGRSWLSFARGSKKPEDAAGSLSYEYDDDYRSEVTVDEFPAKPAPNQFGGKTYNSVESVQEFFRRRDQTLGGRTSSSRQAQTSRPKSEPRTPISQQAGASIVPGSYVRHSKYGRGLVLRREGSGDQIKVTVSFPGYGAKKLIEKYAGLEKD
jgi:DNA helicase-2/ATP-dependent DNA helicase PcrA